MVDYEAMMSHNGGTGHGDRMLGSGLLAGIGLMGMQKLAMSDKMMKQELKEMGGAKFASSLKANKKYFKAGMRGNKVIDRLDFGANKLRGSMRTYSLTGPSGPGQFTSTTFRNSRVNQAAVTKTKDAILQQTALRRTEIGALKSKVGNFKAGMASARGTLKALGWISAISDAFFITESMFNPGPSLSAKAQAADMMAINPLQNAGVMTQRQRSLQAIHDSQLSINPILGNESQYLHR